MPLKAYFSKGFSVILLCAVSNFSFGKDVLTHCGSQGQAKSFGPLTAALAPVMSPKKNYDTANAQTQTLRFRHCFHFRGQAACNVLRSRRQPHSQAAEGEKANPFFTLSNLAAMKHQPVTRPVSWFIDRIGQAVMFTDGGWYVISEIVSDDDAHMKWLSQRNQGLQWFEAPDEMIDQLKAMQP